MLGLRLVKKTVNFDDPGTYHLYYGDEAGQPGTILTFFPWEHAAPGRLGVGETQETVFRVPEGSIGYWTHRFVEKGVPHEAPEKRFGETVLPFKDPDGMRLALSAVPASRASPPGAAATSRPSTRSAASTASACCWRGGPTGRDPDRRARLHRGRPRGLGVRYKAGDTAIGGIVDIREAGGFLPAGMGAGSVHHIAFRAARRCGAGGDGREAGREPRHPHHGAEGPQLFPRRSISASPAASCSRSPPTIRALPSTSRPPRSARR